MEAPNPSHGLVQILSDCPDLNFAHHYQGVLVKCRIHKRGRFELWVRKIPWRRKWQPTPVLFPEKSHGQRNLAGYSSWGRKESDTTEAV